jgi:hypothetical protein
MNRTLLSVDRVVTMSAVDPDADVLDILIDADRILAVGIALDHTVEGAERSGYPRASACPHRAA